MTFMIVVLLIAVAVIYLVYRQTEKALDDTLPQEEKPVVAPVVETPVLKEAAAAAPATDVVAEKVAKPRKKRAPAKGGKKTAKKINSVE